MDPRHSDRHPQEYAQHARVRRQMHERYRPHYAVRVLLHGQKPRQGNGAGMLGILIPVSPD